MKRRKFLYNLGVLVPGAMLAPSMLSSCKKEEKLPNVNWKGRAIVIGAGASGLYAAKLLTEKGATVQILEARNVIGGRVSSETVWADSPLEMGAEEVHGNKSTWYDMVVNAGAKFRSTSGTTDYYEMDGVLKSEDTLNSDTDYNLAQTFIAQATNYSGPDITVQDHILAQGIKSRVRHFINAQVGNEYGASNARVSIKGITEEDQLWTSGNGNYSLTNKTLEEILRSNFADAIAKTKTNTIVKSIDYTGPEIVVTDTLDNEYRCDRVVVTIPITQLQKGTIKFTPDLPTSKTNAINNIGMGAGMKVFLKFSNRFWTDGSIYSAGPVPEYWDASAGRGSDAVLTAFVMGSLADDLSIKGASLLTDIVNDLERLYPGKAKSAYLQGKISDWTTVPHIEGAYSYPMVGGGISMRKELAKPIQNKLFFAGEASHFEGHSATVHGALETGFRAVKELLLSV
jgi:monoamine oxidase